MLPLWYGLGALGDFLELVLLWRVWRGRLWRRYPFFSVFVLYFACSAVIQAAILLWYGYRSRAYAISYWSSDIIVVGLSSFVAWEIFRHSFRRGSSVRMVVGSVSLVLAAAVTGLLLLVHGEAMLPRSMGSFTVNFERYASLVIAPVVLWLIGAAYYYRIPLGRNVWGLAVGFGAFHSLSAISAAVYLLGGSSWLLSSLAFPVAFVLQLLIWAWAFWRYAPNPDLVPMPREQGELDLVLWRQEWNRLLETMRKAFER